ncbi:hypothetical protein DPMN_090058 [Dreissena polymorpha]|uniref:Uncharacterized protein n=1 Tax=Dreissena polymorpha TaxID=45954 RepID=A0A9D4QYR0_DREPO|nr:hypothetical protein DPMN_090058 [Dreissena polymorpha]
MRCPSSDRGMGGFGFNPKGRSALHITLTDTITGRIQEMDVRLSLQAPASNANELIPIKMIH